MDPKFSWYVARSTGLAAWVVLAASVVLGLALSTRATGRKPSAPWLLDLHRFSGGLSLVFVALHLLGLWADSFTHFAWSELFVPMASAWQPGPVAWGIVTMYLLASIEVTSLVMRRLPRWLWRAVHATSFVAFVTATVHLLYAGTDADNRALKWSVVTVSAVVIVLTLLRIKAIFDCDPGADERHATLQILRERVSSR